MKSLLREIGVPVLCIALVAGIFYAHSRHLQSASRAVSSIPRVKSKTEILNGVEHAKRRFLYGKANGTLEVWIEAPGQGSAAAGSTVNLEATVSALTDLEGLKYNWILPADGIGAVNGPLEGDIGTLLGGDSTTLYLSITPSTSENRQIHLHVYRVVGGENTGRMAQFNTVDQERIDAPAKSKAERLEKASAEGRGINYKIYQ